MISRMKIAIALLITSLFCSMPAGAVGNSSPIGIGLFPPLQIPNTDFSIKGLRLGLVNVHKEAAGIDIGLLGNVTTQTFKGFAIATLFNYNNVTSDVIGLQIAGIANINATSSRLYGAQIGLYNKVSKVRGLQIGIINVAQELRGIQIGVININASGPFKVTPIINVAF